LLTYKSFGNSSLKILFAPASDVKNIECYDSNYLPFPKPKPL